MCMLSYICVCVSECISAFVYHGKEKETDWTVLFLLTFSTNKDDSHLPTFQLIFGKAI